MEVTIFFCRLCRLREPAQQIADALQSELGMKAELRKGFWGTFRVEHDGTEVFNRRKDRGFLGRLGFGRTPTPDEIVAIFQNRLAESETATLSD